jgi:hypothetical protein
MPYPNLILPTPIPDAREALLCAQLNLRGARRLLQKGVVRRGVSALYDSVLFGMMYYVARHEGCAGVDLEDATAVFQLLAHAGVFEDGQAFHRLSLTVERFLWQGPDTFDADAILVEVEDMLMRLGVMKIQKTH